MESPFHPEFLAGISEDEESFLLSSGICTPRVVFKQGRA